MFPPAIWALALGASASAPTSMTRITESRRFIQKLLGVATMHAECGGQPLISRPAVRIVKPQADFFADSSRGTYGRLDSQRATRARSDASSAGGALTR